MQSVWAFTLLIIPRSAFIISLLQPSAWESDRMQSCSVWTWDGDHFGYLEGEYLWTHDGKNVGRLRGEFIYAPDGSYLGEIRSANRLLAGISRRSTRGPSFTQKPDRPGVDRRENVASSVMYIGYEDFPPPSAF